jgi:2-methylcitrate dehydratase
MYDVIIEELADYVWQEQPFGQLAMETARLCLADALGCAAAGYATDACKKIAASFFPKNQVDPDWVCHAFPSPWELDPIQAAFSLGSMIRWLDFNDTWLAKEWAHPSDNLGGILPIAELASRKRKLRLSELLSALIKAYEIQGVLSLENSFNQVGIDHVILVKVATAAVAAKLLGGTKEQIAAAISQAFVDLGPMRTYRHAPNVGSRKSWAAGDATSRGVFFALLCVCKGEQGYRGAIETPKFGLEDVLLRGKSLILGRPLGSYVVENILFKVAFPAEFHAQTAVEIGFVLHNAVKDRLDSIEWIDIETHEAAVRIIDKSGKLQNPADRDHCLQYMVAVALLKGSLTAEDYEDEASQNPMIDLLRSKMHVRENFEFTKSYHDSNRRGVPNAIKITFSDGTATERHFLEYPLGHRMRRAEATPLLWQKFAKNLEKSLSNEQIEQLMPIFQDPKEENTSWIGRAWS